MKQMYKAGTFLVLGSLILTACGGGDDRVTFDGQVFRASASAVDKRVSRDLFDATVRDVGVSLDGAKEAGRYEGIKYCIENFGSSDIEWTVGPDSEAAQLVIRDNTLTLRGRCTP